MEVIQGTDKELSEREVMKNSFTLGLSSESHNSNSIHEKYPYFNDPNQNWELLLYNNTPDIRLVWEDSTNELFLRKFQTKTTR